MLGLGISLALGAARAGAGGPVGPAPELALSFAESGPVFTVNRHGTIRWAIAPAVLTKPQIDNAPGVVQRGSIQTISGTNGFQMDELDGTTLLYLSAYLDTGRGVSDVASVVIQEEGAAGALATYTFDGGAFPPAVTIQRADENPQGNRRRNAGTLIDAAGARVFSVANQPRIDHARGVRGLLLEPTRNNFCNGTHGGVTADGTISPSQATKIVAPFKTLSGFDAYWYQIGAFQTVGPNFNPQLVLPAGVSRLQNSIIFKNNPDSGSHVFRFQLGTNSGGNQRGWANINVMTGEIVSKSSADLDVKITPFDNQGRFHMVIAIDVTNDPAVSSMISFTVANTVANTILHIDEPMFEIGSAASSLIRAANATPNTRPVETIRIAENLGPVDLRWTLTDGTIFDQLNQNLNGSWSFVPTVPRKIASITAYPVGGLPA